MTTPTTQDDAARLAEIRAVHDHNVQAMQSMGFHPGPEIARLEAERGADAEYREGQRHEWDESCCGGNCAVVRASRRAADARLGAALRPHLETFDDACGYAMQYNPSRYREARLALTPLIEQAKEGGK